MEKQLELRMRLQRKGFGSCPDETASYRPVLVRTTPRVLLQHCSAGQTFRTLCRIFHTSSMRLDKPSLSVWGCDKRAPFTRVAFLRIGSPAALPRAALPNAMQRACSSQTREFVLHIEGVLVSQALLC